MSPVVQTVPETPPTMAAVASSWVRPQSAMSPAPTNTGSLPEAVLKVQVGPVVVRLPSLTVTYHSNF